MATALIHWTCIFLFKWIFLIIVLFAFSPSLNKKPVLEPESIWQHCLQRTQSVCVYTCCWCCKISSQHQHSTFNAQHLYFIYVNMRRDRETVLVCVVSVQAWSAGIWKPYKHTNVRLTYTRKRTNRNYRLKRARRTHTCARILFYSIQIVHIGWICACAW